MSNNKFSIITPVYNGAAFLEECILSVKNQLYRNYEHIIVDGGSTDGTLDILRKYEGTYPMRWISEKDNGMYDAICKGFRMADGDYCAWLNSDDIYFPWSLSVAAECLKRVHWCTGLRGALDAQGRLYHVDGHTVFRQKWIARGYYGQVFPPIQQESTFWTRDLWERAGGSDISSCKLAGDWKLWTLFARHEPLYTVTDLIGCFRVHAGQLSSDMGKYQAEISRMNRPVGRLRSKLLRIAMRAQRILWAIRRSDYFIDLDFNRNK